jgi:hypothetical protein
MRIDFSEGAYAIINIDFIWNKGTEFASVKPTLEFLSVPTPNQSRGVGTRCVEDILVWMKDNSVEYLAFDNYAKQFWLKLAKRMPASVELAKQYKNTLGILRLSGEDTCLKVFPKHV